MNPQGKKMENTADAEAQGHAGIGNLDFIRESKLKVEYDHSHLPSGR